MKCLVLVILFVFSFLADFGTANAADSGVPEPFQRFDPSSTLTINYDVLTQWLKSVVVDIGPSDRRRAAPLVPGIGTRITPNLQRSTLYEGNRFHFEAFEKNEEAKQALKDIRYNLEQIPTNTPLELFSRDEQLAYWLNLYNITILNEIVSVYPTRDLEELLFGENSILSKKSLTIAEILLSLNDIQFTILKENYDNNPLIMYGLYQGVIGGPNIRKTAYTGADVYRALKYNAIEFTNSNRGTNFIRAKGSEILNVSNLYARNSSYFPDFNADLPAHLLEYLGGKEHGLVNSETIFKPVIEDWTITDLYGTYPVVRNSMATNPAALMGATIGDHWALASMAMRSWMPGISSEALQHLLILNKKRLVTNQNNATVTMEELGEFPIVPEADQENED
jgi:hypothetical protein